MDSTVSPKAKYGRKDGQTLFRLRGHQLLCLLTWKGIAFTPHFKYVFDLMVATIKQGTAMIELVDQPEPQHYVAGANTPPSLFPQDRDIVAIKEIRRHTGLPLFPLSRLKPDERTLGLLRMAFREGRVRTACQECGFHEMCTRIATDHFAEAALSPGSIAEIPATAAPVMDINRRPR